MQIETANDFRRYTLSDGLVGAIKKANYSTPTPVQHSTIPLIVAGLDLIVQSQTGTGKTAAFVIPIIELLDSNPGTLEVLFLAPTRELAKQVGEEFAKFGAHKNIPVTTIYGGTSYENQYKALETAQIVTATPGRLIDLINRGKVDLSKLRVFGLDEADEMLSMGFQEDVDKVIHRLPENRQSLLFSATITPEVRSLGKSMLFYPEFITHSDDSVTADDVTHVYYPISGVGRIRELVRVLEFEAPSNAIIFANTKDDTFMVSRYLKRCGFRAAPLNGDLPQSARERTLEELRSSAIDFIVATDVAARGIDISDLEAVINYQISESAEVYVHRTGRTGRAGNKGRAISLISAGERATLFSIKKHYNVPLTEHPLPTTKDLIAQKQKQFVKYLTKNSKGASNSFMNIAKNLFKNPSKENIKLVAELLSIASKQNKRRTPEDSPREVKSQTGAEKPRSESKNRNERKERGPRAEAKDERGNRNDPREKRPNEKSNEKRSNEKRSNEKRENRNAKSNENASRRNDRNNDKDRNPRKRKDSRPDNRNQKPQSKKPQAKRRNSKEAENYGASRVDKEKDLIGKIWTNIGKNVSKDPNEIIEIICDLAGVMPEDISSVKVEDSFSFIEVRKDYLFDIIKAMHNQEHNGLTITAQQARK